MKQETVHLAIYPTMADWEVGHVVAGINNPRWQEAPGRYRVQTVAETSEPVATMGGVRILPDLLLSELRASQSAMLVLPGAEIWDQAGNVAMARKAREFLAAGVPVAAICGATAGLAREGLLNDRKHTSAAKEYLEATGYAGAAFYQEEACVTDGPLITAGPADAVDFAKHIFAKLELYRPEVLAAWYGLFSTRDSRWMYELMAHVQGMKPPPLPI